MGLAQPQVLVANAYKLISPKENHLRVLWTSSSKVAKEFKWQFIPENLWQLVKLGYDIQNTTV